MKWRAILTILLLNLVPAFGWFFQEWSPGTTLAVYWFENFAIVLFITMQIVIHRRFNRVRGHFAYLPPAGVKTNARTYLGAYFSTALAFVAGHALFLALFLLFFFPKKFGSFSGIDWQGFSRGAGMALLFLTINFLLSIPQLQQGPFRWLEEAGQRSQSRIILLQLVIIGGMFIVLSTNSPRGLFGIFIVLKALADLSDFIPFFAPQAPPSWMSPLWDKLKPKDQNESFAAWWKKQKESERVRQSQNEEML